MDACSTILKIGNKYLNGLALQQIYIGKEFINQYCFAEEGGRQIDLK